MDQETGETAQTSVDIEVLQKGQSGKHTAMYTSTCTCLFNSSKNKQMRSSLEAQYSLSQDNERN